MSIQINLNKILTSIPKNITLVAATKKRTTNEILESVKYGIKVIGENYLQEAEKKYHFLKGKVKIHCIGRLQKNKVKKAVEIFDMIQTVDSIDLAKEIDKRSRELNKTMPILIEVNSGKEENKSGVFPIDVNNVAKEISNLNNIRIKGLMTMAPFSVDPEKARPYFKLTKRLYDEMNQVQGVEQAILSMGMSDSYKIAIQEGSNMVRLGTKIFGQRDS